jgi:hypothetical protein
MIVHPDDNDRSVRRDPRHNGQPRERLGSEHGFVEHHHIRRNPTQEQDQICKI